jgi:isopenicillin-N epimerase
MLGSLASLPVPAAAGRPADAPSSALELDPLHEALFRRGLQVPIVSCPAHPGRLLRVSAALYNERSDYERLAAALGELGFGSG